MGKIMEGSTRWNDRTVNEELGFTDPLTSQASASVEDSRKNLFAFTGYLNPGFPLFLHIYLSGASVHFGCST